MLTPDALHRLQSFDGQGALVLSAYVDIAPASQVRRAYLAAFDDMVKAGRDGVDDATGEQYEREADRVRTWLDGDGPRGQGAMVFSCEPRDLWHAEFLGVRVEDHLVFEAKPDLAPAIELADEYERYVVAAVDKRRAKLFGVFGGRIEDREEFEDEIPGKHDQGGLSQGRIQRHQEEMVYRHLKKVADRLAQRHRARPFDRLILAGPTPATTDLRRVLPRTLASRVAAVVPVEMVGGEQEILDKTLEVERGVERAAEERLLDELLGQSGPAERTAIGVDATLAALWADVVQVLVVARGSYGAGAECPNCRRLEPRWVPRCSMCDAAMHRVHDFAHAAMGRALEQSARVDVVRGAAAVRLVDVGGGMGAFLRYATPVPDATR